MYQQNQFLEIDCQIYERFNQTVDTRLAQTFIQNWWKLYNNKLLVQRNFPLSFSFSFNKERLRTWFLSSRSSAALARRPHKSTPTSLLEFRSGGRPAVSERGWTFEIKATKQPRPNSAVRSLWWQSGNRKRPLIYCQHKDLQPLFQNTRNFFNLIQSKKSLNWNLDES